MKKLITHGLFVFAAAAAPLVAGCTDQKTELCDAICSCENCGDKGQERCDIGVQSELDIAETYGCLSQAEEYIDCVISEGKCNGGKFSGDSANCSGDPNAPKEKFEACKADSSRRLGGKHPY